MDLKFRRGTDRDAVAVSALYLRARKAAKATIPMTAHTDDETRRWIASGSYLTPSFGWPSTMAARS